MIKYIIIIIIITVICIKLIDEAGWYGYEKLIIGSMLGIDILFLGIINLLSSPVQITPGSEFLGDTPSGLIIGLIPGVWIWGVISIFRIIKYMK